MMAYWTDKYFGSLYHEIYSKHLLDPQRALEEAAFAAEVLDLGRRTVLDLACGFGRHARLLAKSNRVIAVDRTLDYLRAARDGVAGQASHNLTLARGDMRDIPLRDKAVDAAVMLFNSFGYFGADADNPDNDVDTEPKRQVWKLPSVFYERQLVDTGFGKFKDPVPAASDAELPLKETVSGPDVQVDPNADVLREVFRVLKPRGGFLLEIPNKRLLLEAVAENPRRLMVVDGYEIHEQFEWDAVTQRLSNKTRFVAGNREEAASYSLRLFEPAEIRELLGCAGFKVRRVYGDYEAGRFGPASSDIMLIHSVRPARK